MSSLPPILVINLKRSEDRRRHMEKELGRFGVKYSFFRAVDGNKLTREERRSYSLKHAVSTHNKPLSNKQIGCALSHIYVYKKMVAQSIKEMLILEDDCIFEDHFFDLLNCRESWLPSGWGLINFRTSVRDHDTDRIPLHNLSSSIPPLQLIALKRENYQTSCQLINLHGVQQLLDIAYPIRTTADRLTGLASISRLNTYTIFPPVVRGARFRSTIGAGRGFEKWKGQQLRGWAKLRHGADRKSAIEEDRSPGTLKRISMQELIKKELLKLGRRVREITTGIEP